MNTPRIRTDHTSQMRGITITRGDSTLRIVLDMYGRAGCYFPVVNVSRKGPNGSISGIGPKPFGPVLSYLFGKRYGHAPRSARGAIMLGFNVPHIPWMRAYKLRKVGGYKLYKLNAWAIRKLAGL